MTAFARKEREGEWGKLTWELRSVNHRYLDAHPRLPEELRFLETGLRERVGQKLGRGKVECALRFRPTAGAGGELQINWPYARQVVAACDGLRTELGDAAAVSPLELLRTPGVVQEAAPDMEPLANAALELLDEALAELVSVREREGERLAAIVGERAAQVGSLTETVRGRRAEVNRQVRQRLQSRLDELQTAADPGRLEQELVFLAQRMDVDEELERLLTHVGEVQRVLERDEPVGRRLDFLMQELNREANTLASKSSDAETTQAAVEMKVLIEQMREQVQNIE
jgi:uncharacterized protein (TIGR00255 family)